VLDTEADPGKVEQVASKRSSKELERAGMAVRVAEADLTPVKHSNKVRRVARVRSELFGTDSNNS
jgi:hypothetical protein